MAIGLLVSFVWYVKLKVREPRLPRAMRPSPRVVMFRWLVAFVGLAIMPIFVTVLFHIDGSTVTIGPISVNPYAFFLGGMAVSLAIYGGGYFFLLRCERCGGLLRFHDLRLCRSCAGRASRVNRDEARALKISLDEERNMARLHSRLEARATTRLFLGLAIVISGIPLMFFKWYRGAPFFVTCVALSGVVIWLRRKGD